MSFNEKTSDKILLNAIDYFKNKHGNITATAPQDFLDCEEKESLKNDNAVFRVSLYKILLFIHVTDNIKSGKLNLKYSYHYRAIQDYLINKKTWDLQRNELLKLAGLEAFSNYNSVLKNLAICLDEKYNMVNQRILSDLNPYISFNEKNDNRIQITTPAFSEKETKHISAFLKQVGYVPLLQVLSDVNQMTKFTNTLTHHSLKHSKQKPHAATFYATIIGLGCNIGVSKMAQISSGINQNTINNALNWYFSLKTINAANEKIREFINRLALPHTFAEN